jgi:ribosomal protein L44E
VDGGGWGVILYTDIEPFCCDVLRARVADGGLLPGDVWERDVRTLTADELRPYHQVHLFCGVGASPLGLKWAGWPQPMESIMAGKLKKLTQGDVDEAVRMYVAGASLAGVAARFAITRQAAWDLLRRRTDLRPQARFGSDNNFYRGGPEAVDAAHNKVEKAVKRGELVPQPCEVCGADYRMADGRRAVQAHHDDYSKPLEVRWLCQRCHHSHHEAEAARREEVNREAAFSIVTGGFPS